MRRLTLTVALTLLVLGCWGTAPALADDPPAPVFPSGLPGPDDVGNNADDPTPVEGPTFVVTPGSGGTALPPPVTAPVDLPTEAIASPIPGKKGERAKNMVAAPIAAADEPDEVPLGGTGWWLAASGLLILVVLTEFGRVNRSRRRADEGAAAATASDAHPDSRAARRRGVDA